MSESLSPHGLNNDYEFTPVGWWADTLHNGVSEELNGANKTGRGNIVLEHIGDDIFISIRDNGDSSAFSLSKDNGQVIIKTWPGGIRLNENDTDDIAHDLYHRLDYGEFSADPAKTCCN